MRRLLEISYTPPSASVCSPRVPRTCKLYLAATSSNFALLAANLGTLICTDARMVVPKLSKISLVKYFFNNDLESEAANLAKPSSNLKEVWMTKQNGLAGWLSILVNGGRKIGNFPAAGPFLHAHTRICPLYLTTVAFLFSAQPFSFPFMHVEHASYCRQFRHACNRSSGYLKRPNILLGSIQYQINVARRLIEGLENDD
uniref:Uncharacterized protein n=1 Tax=Glossina austeni TaxID=7395 RepID=A0A1A9VEA2_GLOAU